MGETGNGKGSGGAGETEGAVFVLDAGALIAFERGNRQIRGFLTAAGETRERILVPASALAQVWRGSPRSAPLAHLMSAAEVDVLDEPRAREAGERLGRQNKTDIADAHIVCCALEHDADLITSDADDMEGLLAPHEHLVLVRL